MQISDSVLGPALVDRAWRQWVALGVDAVAEADDDVVDPEALIALTAELGDADARLRDVSTDWCVAFGRYVNGTRLKTVAAELGTPLDRIGEYVATVAAAGGPRWPMGTEPRPGYVSRRKARLRSAAQPARLRVRLRAAFGVNARADVLAALLASGSVASSLADIARVTRFSKLNVAAAVDALGLAGLVDIRVVGNEQRVTIAPVDILPGLRAPVFQVDWVAMFGLALATSRFLARDVGPPAVRAIEARRMSEEFRPWTAAARMPTPDEAALGPDYAAAFDRWVIDLADRIRGPR